MPVPDPDAAGKLVDQAAVPVRGTRGSESFMRPFQRRNDVDETVDRAHFDAHDERHRGTVDADAVDVPHRFRPPLEFFLAPRLVVIPGPRARQTVLAVADRCGVRKDRRGLRDDRRADSGMIVHQRLTQAGSFGIANERILCGTGKQGFARPYLAEPYRKPERLGRTLQPRRMWSVVGCGGRLRIEAGRQADHDRTLRLRRGGGPGGQCGRQQQAQPDPPFRRHIPPYASEALRITPFFRCPRVTCAVSSSVSGSGSLLGSGTGSGSGAGSGWGPGTGGVGVCIIPPSATRRSFAVASPNIRTQRRTQPLFCDRSSAARDESTHFAVDRSARTRHLLVESGTTGLARTLGKPPPRSSDDSGRHP
ncbi:hypothetical protein ebA3122 [Aromatoleum aromaticum EbN1]|uniref:Uncharacterized protein n=1 Tax=Aromatoleum aromaticum (strain DSM 19018 / LMG 30748 / EbN1) TaxID=76114 RepID=Q5P488_AROAE|nr:hypothetical protein ebA3122 [Aromatoleum aromaticum EbN1]